MMAATDIFSAPGKASAIKRMAGSETPGTPVFDNPTNSAPQRPAAKQSSGEGLAKLFGRSTRHAPCAAYKSVQAIVARHAAPQVR